MRVVLCRLCLLLEYSSYVFKGCHPTGCGSVPLSLIAIFGRRWRHLLVGLWKMTILSSRVHPDKERGRHTPRGGNFPPSVETVSSEQQSINVSDLLFPTSWCQRTPSSRSSLAHWRYLAMRWHNGWKSFLSRFQLKYVMIYAAASHRRRSCWDAHSGEGVRTCCYGCWALSRRIYRVISAMTSERNDDILSPFALWFIKAATARKLQQCVLSVAFQRLLITHHVVCS